MEERAACAVLKSRFEAAGFRIAENTPFEEDGVRFEIDGFDPDHRVGYEYLTSEAGDGWDVDGTVIAALEERKQRGELFVLVVDEADAPDEASLRERADAFIEELRELEVVPEDKPAKQAAKPAAKKPVKKPAAKKPAAKKPAKRKRR